MGADGGDHLTLQGEAGGAQPAPGRLGLPEVQIEAGQIDPDARIIDDGRRAVIAAAPPPIAAMAIVPIVPAAMVPDAAIEALWAQEAAKGVNSRAAPSRADRAALRVEVGIGDIGAAFSKSVWIREMASNGGTTAPGMYLV
jgi:hypothetical protein